MPTIKPFCVKWEDSDEFREFIELLKTKFHSGYIGDIDDCHYGVNVDNTVKCAFAPFAELLTPSQAIARMKGEDEVEKLKGLLRECEKYVAHDEECNYYTDDLQPDADCSCGKDKLIKQIKEAIK